MLIGIYLIRNLITGMCYVGQSVDIKTRWRHHKCYRDSTPGYIANAIKKHGIDAFAFEILELCEEDNLNQREIHWIARLNSVSPNGYNLEYGGRGGRPSAEACAKMSEATKGQIPWNKGKKMPPHFL